MPEENVAAIILAAGNSSRMGQDKFLLSMEDGTNFIRAIVKSFHSFVSGKIVVVTTQDSEEQLKSMLIPEFPEILIAVNLYPEKGRFSSVKTGIREVGSADWYFIQNADNPFTDETTLESLYSNRLKAASVYPAFEGKGGHPVLINRSCAHDLLFCGDESILKEELLKRGMYEVPVKNPKIIANINTPKEYKEYFG